MTEKKLVLCVCGGGINTSLNAETKINEYLSDNGITDVEVKHAMIGDINPYRGRKNMVVVWMTQIDPGFQAPAFRAWRSSSARKRRKQLCARKLFRS